MNLHVLFCPTETVGPDGASFPIAALSLSLDDEVQYRCAGFIQAEIERYAEELDESAASDHKGSNVNETSESESEEATPTKGKKGKGKKPTKDDELPGMYIFPNCGIVLKCFFLVNTKQSRSNLEQEYLFIGVISTFLRAIRAGAIHVRHGAVLLAHYGRLGSTFDECSKIMVDVLREEGMGNGNPDVVVVVVTQAIRDVCPASFYYFMI
jgi:cohesin complex subunit SA-1/2